MFQLIQQSESIKWPVKVDLVDANGGVIQRSFKAKFKRLSQEEIDAAIAATLDGSLSDQEHAQNILVGWDEINDEDGNPLEFTPDNRDKVLNIHPVRPSIIEAWFECVKARKKK